MDCRNVLLIDDDIGIRETMAELLELYGFNVITACNGKEGLEKLELAAPCLILLDMMMPVMNGWEFLKNLRERGSAMLAEQRVAIVTALGLDLKELQDFGCPVLGKPVNMDRVLELARARCA